MVNAINNLYNMFVIIDINVNLFDLFNLIEYL